MLIYNVKIVTESMVQSRREEQMRPSKSRRERGGSDEVRTLPTFPTSLSLTISATSKMDKNAQNIVKAKISY